MKHAAEVLVFARIFVAFVGLSHLFGQLFFSTFSVSDTTIGLAGLLISAFGGRSFVLRSKARGATLLCMIGLVLAGEVGAAYRYYTSFDVPGNSFGWELRGPFILAILLVAWSTTSSADRLFGREEHAG